ncbi:thiopeptide-type bacteriocin biosynthesis protein [Streptomyces yaizuensis]|uniref:Thiopeptide-type bacteriocin biosynthesis protein n=1 Tax=Streptomyces yaizuensis TaxID=2989713 RepID=A0ABQ5P9P6_9ACTN|nr:thiopeptide-type bacteriocin biosynthesis protein [Streptomyces sp. YSPA8]GLF99272.1 thiopeptide-type bacteriocin biosynthesis protein [Streptomyces sp. YSPA8]
MSADRLNAHHQARKTVTVAVLDVLAGTPLAQAADGAGLEPADLALAVDVFCQAGSRALEQQTVAPGWWQIYAEFPDWTTAETTAATHLAPLLGRAATEWWFIRKHPCWRIRLRTTGHPDGTKTTVSTALNRLAAAGHIRRWWTGSYEAESAAFGGTEGMTAAHSLFHADSQAILTQLHGRRNSLGRREISVLLCTSLMRGAGLEWYEQGDIWHQVSTERPLPPDATLDRLRPMAADLNALLLADLRLDGPLFGEGGPAKWAAEWAAGFRDAGRALGVAARAGRLERGLRQVIAYHVIFHWNRLGLPARAQSILASAARTAVLGE